VKIGVPREDRSQRVPWGTALRAESPDVPFGLVVVSGGRVEFKRRIELVNEKPQRPVIPLTNDLDPIPDEQSGADALTDLVSAIGSGASIDHR
jgi:hypothetical protein